MLEWRERGYVQDSDEDGSIADEDTAALPETTTFLGSSKINGSENTIIQAPQAAQSLGRSSSVEPGYSRSDDHRERAKIHNPNHEISARGNRGNDGFDDIDELQLDSTPPRKNDILGIPHKSISVKPNVQDLEVFESAEQQGEHGYSTEFRGLQAGSTDSSPLSSLRSSRLSVPPGDVGSTSAERSRDDAAQHVRAGLSRSFRPRNPIQLHPYLLENEQYRQSLRARGIRPVAVAHQHVQGCEETQDGETQYQDAPNEGESQSPLFSSSPVSLRSHSPIDERIEVSGGDNLDLDADDLPDLADLLRRKHYGSEPQRHKRQKLSHSTEQMTPVERHSGSQAIAVWITPALTTNYLGDLDFYEGPVSPSEKVDLTKRINKKTRLKRFRHPKAISSAQLPTPVTSSDPAKRTMDIVHSDSGSDIESLVPDAGAPSQNVDQPPIGSFSPSAVHGRSPSPVSSKSGSEGEMRRKKVSRRIKGVLPASWLRINAQAQSSKALRHSPIVTRDGSPEKVLPQRGVARRLSGGARQRPDHNSTSSKIIDISDGSGLDEESVRGGHDFSKMRRPEYEVGVSRSFHNGAEHEDAEESDWVDPMLPTVSRTRRTKRERKRQQRITDTFKSLNPGHEHGDGITMHKSFDDRFRPHYHAKTKSYNTPISQTKRAPRLSIVDMLPSVPQSAVPDFLRVAVRQARRRPDKGRHSPERKTFSLHSYNDNAEIRDSLKKWKRGRTKLPSRKPLTEANGNKQSQLAHSTKFISRSPSRETKERTGENVDPKRSQEQNGDGDVKNPLPPAPKSANSAPQRQTPHRQHRPGQLEALQVFKDRNVRKSTFQQNLLNLDEHFYHVRAHKQRLANPLVEKFLAEAEVSHASSNEPTVSTAEDRRDPAADKQSKASGQNQRKRNPHPLHLRRGDFRRVESENHFPSELQHVLTQNSQNLQGVTIQGLRTFGSAYTLDFGIKPFSVGQHFHHATFIGSGDFQKVLDLRLSDIDSPVNVSTICYQDGLLRLGPWTEEGFWQIYRTLGRFLEGTATGTDLGREESTQPTSLIPIRDDSMPELRSVIRYLSKGLHFFDPSDRNHCIEKLTGILETMIDSLGSFSNTSEVRLSATANPSATIRLTTYLCVLSFEIIQIAAHTLVKQESKGRAEELFKRTIASWASVMTQNGFQSLRKTITERCNQSPQDIVFDQNNVEVEALVVLHHLLDKAELHEVSLWNVLEPAFTEQRHPETLYDVDSLERVWHGIFCMLPLLAVDPSGVSRPGPRLTTRKENWIVILPILSNLFKAYSASTRAQATSMNSYLRAVFGRCFTLVESWGWWNCESMLSCIFDFYAGRGLGSLCNEGSKGPPAFLENLDKEVVPTLETSDHSFDIFLKTIAVSLLRMQSVYAPKKIKNIAWRFVPNHGRKHDKESELEETDLVTLRNHHNLLCVLYFASPPSFRISLDLVRNLVDFRSSHSEVCRLNVRTWTNIVRFQLSITEETAAITALADWLNAIVNESLLQYHQARAEAENQLSSTDLQGLRISKAVVEATIAGNQKQVEGVLTMALACLSSVMRSAKSSSSSKQLFEKSCISNVFGLCDPKQTRRGGAVGLALETYMAYFALFEARRLERAPQQDNEDSQDYGEWTGLDDIAGMDEDEDRTYQSLDEATIDPLQRAMREIFVSEKSYDEHLLRKFTETWVVACRLGVKLSHRDWSFYLDPHSPGAWHQFGDTMQGRKLYPYFLAEVLRGDISAYEDNVAGVLSAWLTSLVERESMLLYQNHLTAALLNADALQPLLLGVPFARRAGQEIHIELYEIRDRRLEILRTVFGNMRQTVEDCFLRSSNDLRRLRQEYAMMLKQMMAEMRKRYQETQQDKSQGGAYVHFVQRVIEMFQEYCSEICSVDKFFTDSAAFPLPTTDPTYVTGRLKSYHSKLGDPKLQKKLATFVQATCERAALDNQREYFTTQLAKSVEGTFEHGELPQPSLRQFMLEVLFPPFVELAFSTECGWVFAAPLLDATRFIFDSLLYSCSVTDRTTLTSLVRMITVFLQSILTALDHVSRNHNLFHQANTLSILGVVFRALNSALVIVDYVQRLSQMAASLVQLMLHFHRFGMFAIGHLREPPGGSKFSESIEATIEVESSLKDVRRFCEHEAQSMMRKYSTEVDNGERVLNGGSRKAVVTGIGTLDEEKENATTAIECFMANLKRLPAFLIDKVVSVQP